MSKFATALEKGRSEPEPARTAARSSRSSRAEKNPAPPAEDLKGRGRLLPALATGIEYPVVFGFNSPPAPPQYGRVSRPTRWVKCLIRTAQKKIFPDGNYFLHTDEGRVLQLKVIGGVWHSLALAF